MEFLCDCGQLTIKTLSNIKLRRVVSCGCYNRSKPQNLPYSLEKATSAFMDKVVKQPNGCWLWKGNINQDGYGQVRFIGKTMGAHRASWIIHRGEIAGLHVLHGCDNPPCVNPEHLFLGTHSDNVRDCVAKGRYFNGGRQGEKSYVTPFKNADVLKIRELAGLGRSRMSIAKQFSVCRQSIDAIVNRETWTHI